LAILTSQGDLPYSLPQMVNAPSVDHEVIFDISTEVVNTLTTKPE
jgi:hypothetical protein